MMTGLMKKTCAGYNWAGIKLRAKYAWLAFRTLGWRGFPAAWQACTGSYAYTFVKSDTYIRGSSFLQNV